MRMAALAASVLHVLALPPSVDLELKYTLPKYVCVVYTEVDLERE